MSTLGLGADALLSTMRAVRKRLDFDRPVERGLLNECLAIALQAPTGSNAQGWQFMVVDDHAQKQAIAALYKKAWTHEETEKTIRDSAGQQFDPELVDIFFQNLEDLFAVRAKYPD